MLVCPCLSSELRTWSLKQATPVYFSSLSADSGLLTEDFSFTLPTQVARRFENNRHFVNLVHRVNEHVNMIRHEDIGKDGEVVLLRCLVDAVGKGSAYSVIEQVLSTVMGREGYVVRMPEGVERIALVEIRLFLSRHSGVLPGRHLVIVSLSCLSSQLLRPPSPAASADRSQVVG